MKFEEALKTLAQAEPATKYMTHGDMCSGRHCYVRYQGEHKALKLVNFQTKLEQDWTPSPRDLTRADWQILEE